MSTEPDHRPVPAVPGAEVVHRAPLMLDIDDLYPLARDLASTIQIESLVPRIHWEKVLVEWENRFAEDWGVKERDRPVLFAVDAEGIVRWRHAGPIAPEARESLAQVLDPP